MSDARPLVIVGAGGHGRVVLDTWRATGRDAAGFLDGGQPLGTPIHGVPVLGGNAKLDDSGFLAAHQFVVAIGNQRVRRELSLKILNNRGTLATVVHPSVIVSPTATIDLGTVVVAGVVINTDARIGRYCIVNTSATLDHDVVLADGVQICPGANLAGAVHCEALVFVGTGAVVVPGVRIGENSVVGAGTVVLRALPANVLAVGNPARIVRNT
jgi:acetyltransferase EpsM